MSKPRKTNRKNMVLDVTKEDYNREAAAGVEEEFRLKPGRHQFRHARTVATREELSPRNTKVRITIYIDLDILNYFKKHAEPAAAAPYQTQINNALREYIERAEEPADYSRLIEDEGFLNALEERLGERLSSRFSA